MMTIKRHIENIWNSTEGIILNNRMPKSNEFFGGLECIHPSSNI